MSLKTAIMGFGNPVRSDDAIGVYVVQTLQNKITNPSISIFDMGTSAFEVLFKLEGHQKIIIVDAVINSGTEPGEIFKLPASEIKAQINDDPMVFLHGLKWDQALSYAKKIMQDKFPEDIQVYLISISDLRLEVQMSPEVQEAGDKVVNYILDEVGD